jgi:hypothetical protein
MVARYIEAAFPTVDGNELARLNAQLFLSPLYRQLLNLCIEEYANSGIITKKGRINPVLKEIREVLRSLQRSVVFIQDQAEKQLLTLPSANLGEDLSSSSYYDMLLTEGKTDKNEQTDIGL